MRQIVKTIKPSNQIQAADALLDYMKYGSRGIICQVYDGEVSILTNYNRCFDYQYAFYEGGDAYNSASKTPVETLNLGLGELGCSFYYFDNWSEFAQAVIDNDWH